MSKEEIFNYFYTNSVNLSVGTILVVMLAGLIIGALIYLTYFATYRGVAYNSRFNASLVIILLVTVVIMLMISSNLVVSLGMVGALSIVRFRTAVKDSRDTIFIFWAIAEGLSVGSQNFKLALVTTIFIAIIIILVSLEQFTRNKYMVVICGDDEAIDSEKLNEALSGLCQNVKLKSANISDNHQEMIYEVKVNGDFDVSKTESISKLAGVKSVNWVAESGENVG